ncbi:PAS domain-containing protein [Nitrobacter sp.]|jgi:PAS domain S-box-containing protein|uniref:PAS domain-containing protein n=1 Tax=Nitrobacter sp. TaxID=29420 RepID=UPI003F64BC6B
MDTSAIAAALLHSAADAVIATDRDGTITFWNPGAVRIFGHGADEAVGSSLDLIIPESLRARHWAGYRDVMRTGQSRYSGGDVLAVPALHKDGRRISLEFTIVPVKDAAGRITGLVSTLRDVTARFEEIRELRRKCAASDAR